MSNALSLQLFVGVPLEVAGIGEEDADKFGLEIGNSGVDLQASEENMQTFIGLEVGLPVTWDGEWAQGVSQEEFEEVMDKVKEGLKEAGVEKKPGLYFLVNYY